jgi:mannitol 2-dehydrogenase
MVDRITPVTTDRHRTLLAAELGVEDGWPVFSEPYGEWHVEHFGGARPALELVGVDFADRATVEAHEQRKIRVLNGAHQAITYIGLLLGHTYCHEAIRDEDVAVFAARVMAEEIAPCVGPVPASDGSDEGVGAYAERTRARFANSRLEDTLERIGTDSWIRMTRFVVPSLLDQIRAGGPHQLLSFVVATWLRALAARPSVRRVVGGPVEPALREALAAGADAAALVHVAGLLPDALVASPAARTITDQLAELGAGDRQQARRALRDVLTRAAR